MRLKIVVLHNLTIARWQLSTDLPLFCIVVERWAHDVPGSTGKTLTNYRQKLFSAVAKTFSNKSVCQNRENPRRDYKFLKEWTLNSFFYEWGEAFGVGGVAASGGQQSRPIVNAMAGLFFCLFLFKLVGLCCYALIFSGCQK
jgi:hypothetical protein